MKEKQVYIQVSENTKLVLESVSKEHGMSLNDYLAHKAWEAVNNRNKK